MADNKLATKHFLSARGIPVPRLYGVIKSREEAQKFDFHSLPSSFVIKPNFGYGGEGIIPIIDREEGLWIQSNGGSLTKNDFINHCIDIIDGRFSLSSIRDTVFFEQHIYSEETLAAYSYKGLPDIRIVVHNLIPVMAMLRLPTKDSGGKANLHQGAIGVGIDIARGEATHCVYKGKIIDEIPEKGKIRGLKIPDWDELLFIASKTQLITNLGYMAVDLSIDRHTGPVILEINARAGLGVQIANLAPLRRRLERIQGIKITTPGKGVRVAKDLFGNVAEKEIAHATGKKVIGLEETVSLILKNETCKTRAKVATGSRKSAIDAKFATEIGIHEKAGLDCEKSTVKLKLSISGTRIQTVMDVREFAEDDIKIILGSRDLQNFIIDPNKKNTKGTLLSLKAAEQKFSQPQYKLMEKAKINLAEIDQKLVEIDSKIKLLYHLRPVNLDLEREKWLLDHCYNPHFIYPELQFEPYELYRELDRIETDSSPAGQLFAAVRQEIEKKIALLEQRGTPIFTEISIDLFGKPSAEEYDSALNRLMETGGASTYNESPLEEMITGEKAAEMLARKIEEYNLQEWKVKIKEDMVADCVAGKNSTIFIRKNARFSHERIEDLIIHEIETHILTAENGKRQPYQMFQRGFANYLVTQEGLATWNVDKFGKGRKSDEKRSLITLVSIGASLLYSFSKVATKLQELGLSPEKAFQAVLKVKRGVEDTSLPGGFTKGYVYSRGKAQIERFVESGWDLRELYYGKFNLNNLPEVKQIPNIVPPKYLPKWLS